MKRILLGCLTLILCVSLNSCGISQNKQNMDILIAESWKTYCNGITTEITFNEDGNGFFDGSDMINFIWHLEENTVTIKYTYLGNPKEESYAIVSDGESVELHNNLDADQVLVRSSEYVQVEIKYYEECDILPAVDTIVPVNNTGHLCNSTDGIITNQEYTYAPKNNTHDINTILSNYIAYLKESNIEASVDANGIYSIFESTRIIAKMYISNGEIVININPYYEFERDVKYYEEYHTLPTVDSIVLARQVDSNSTTSNDSFTKLEYKYNALTAFQDNQALLDEYIQCLPDYGYRAVKTDDSFYYIDINGESIGTLSFENEYFALNFFISGTSLEKNFIEVYASPTQNADVIGYLRIDAPINIIRKESVSGVKWAYTKNGWILLSQLESLD